MSGINLDPAESQIWRIVQAIIQIMSGRSNAVGEITLTPNQSTTVVTARNCADSSKPQLTPKTANGAAAYPTTWISAVSRGSFTISHANNAQADRSFHWETFG